MSFPDWGSSVSQGRICLIPTVSFHQRVTSNFSAKGFNCAFSTFNRRLVSTVTSGLLVHPNNLTLFLRLVLQLQVRVKIVRQLPIGTPRQRIHRFQSTSGLSSRSCPNQCRMCPNSSAPPARYYPSCREPGADPTARRFSRTELGAVRSTIINGWKPFR